MAFVEFQSKVAKVLAEVFRDKVPLKRLDGSFLERLAETSPKQAVFRYPHPPEVSRMMPTKGKIFINTRRTHFLAATALGACVSCASSVSAVIYHNGQPTQPFIDLGSQLAARNGGPSVTMVLNSPDYPPISGIPLNNGEMVLSGTLGPRDQSGSLTVFGGAHSLFSGPTLPSRITRIRLYTGTNYLSDPGQMLEVDLSTLRLAPGADGTFATMDLFGAKVVGDVPLLGDFTIGDTVPGEAVTHAGVGLAASVDEAAYGSFAPRDFTMRGWRANNESLFAYNDVSRSLFEASDFHPTGNPSPNGRLTQGDSNGPVIRSSSFNTDGAGRISSLQLSGIGVGYSLGGGPSGQSIYVDFGTAAAQKFVNQFTGQGFTPGDATVDGAVDFNDLLILAQNYGATSGRIWGEGDFTGDKAVNFADLLMLAQNYGTGSSLTVPGASPDLQSDWALAQSMVPEPTSLLFVAGAGVLARRRRA